jgi:signal peptidase I
MAKQSSGGTMEFVRTIIYAILIALVARTFAFEPFSIPSGSMKPTLLIGDYLFVKKWTYGYSRHSFPLSQPPFTGRFLSQPVERGDIVVFKVPRDEGRDFGEDYIKRIVGLPGDRIQMIKGILHINGEAVKRVPAGEWLDRDYDGQNSGENGTEDDRVLTQYIETLPNGVEHLIIEESDNGSLDNTDEITVPPGHYFGMGDNRDNSSDSRVFGFIPEENLVGRASFIFYSTGSGGSLLRVWDSIPRTRLDRLFNGIR